MKQKDKLEILRTILKTKLPKSHNADIFIELANLDITNSQRLINFCKKYRYLPGEHPTKSVEKLIEDEQVKISSFLKKYISKTLSESDLKNLNERLGNCKRQIKFVEQEELTGINNQIDTDTNTDFYPGSYLIEVYTYPNITDHAWLYLSEFILKEQQLFECLNCARFFLPEQNRKMKFCSLECKNAYNARKRRVRKK